MPRWRRFANLNLTASTIRTCMRSVNRNAVCQRGLADFNNAQLAVLCHIFYGAAVGFAVNCVAIMQQKSRRIRVFDLLRCACYICALYLHFCQNSNHYEITAIALCGGGFPPQSERFGSGRGAVYFPARRVQADTAFGGGAGHADFYPQRQAHCIGYPAGAGDFGNCRADFARSSKH